MTFYITLDQEKKSMQLVTYDKELKKLKVVKAVPVKQEELS